jgi:hypothetical protein
MQKFNLVADLLLAIVASGRIRNGSGYQGYVLVASIAVSSNLSAAK